MTQSTTSVDISEIKKFEDMAAEWWAPEGKFKPLHEMNPVRLGFIRDSLMAHYALPPNGLKPLQGLNVLDIGCGGGLLCEPLCRLGAGVTGIDAAAVSIEVARKHAEQMGLEVNYQAITAEELIDTNVQYDAVFAMEVVEHVADIPGFIESAAKLLKPGGLFIASTLNRTTKSWLAAIVGAEYILRWLPVGTHDWAKFPKPDELKLACEQAGLTLVDKRGMVPDLLKGTWNLSDTDLSVNYVIAAEKPKI